MPAMTVARKIPKTDDEIYQELLDALSQIDFGVKGFNEGVRSAYMGVAVELRKLLCDKRPLVNRILEKPAYHPLWHDVNEEQQPGWNLPFFTGSFITYDADVFDLNRPRIPLDVWLVQGIARQPGHVITIKELIRSVADKQAAHADDDWNTSLVLARSVRSSAGINLGVGTGFHQPYICAIGAYVSFDTRRQIAIEFGT
jgi:hypothetical protein